jgi:glycosyltransferase involved in cell wall biosynthesis
VKIDGSLMRILFINYHHLDSNSGIHIFNLANHLSHLGVVPTVCVPDSKGTAGRVGKAEFGIVTFDEASRGWVHGRQRAEFDLIHAWTPREVVRTMTEELVSALGVPYVVHMEDNEDAIFTAFTGIPVASAMAMEQDVLDRGVGKHLSHPVKYRSFLHGAIGVTVIMETLLKFVPEGIPTEVIWPGYEEHYEWAQPTNYRLRRRHGIADEENVIAYTGNVHAANRDEVFSLYVAVGLLNRRGHPTRLLRTGSDHVQLYSDELDLLGQHCITLGRVPRRSIPSVLSAANLLVQPGRPGEFNDYRFPAKVPEFLASGRPVLLPPSNIGRYLKDGAECILLPEGGAVGIVRSAERLFSEPSLASQIGAGGRAFAEKNLKWSKSAEKLLEFYKRVLCGADGLRSLTEELHTRTTVHDAMGSEDVVERLQSRWRDRISRSSRGITAHTNTGVPHVRPRQDDLVKRYQSHQVPRIGYATVRDYCDSYDHLRELATLSRDLKDVQRPWAVKAIVSRVPAGSRLLEIGGGEPIVAQVLTELGYELTVVDPYDGSGNGPTDYQGIVKRYPDIRFVRRLFDHEVPGLQPGSFECIYSISVLEHVTKVDIPRVFTGIRRFVAPGRGFSIHAVDHVLRGWDEEHHLGQLRIIADELAISEGELAEMLQRLAEDTDTYFLSAEGHNLWRGRRTYDEFPFRRCVSIQVCQPT